MTNKEIAKTFQYLGNIMELHGENKFKIRSYQNAYVTLRKLDEPLAEMEDAQIAQIKGVGKAIAAKIRELVDSGKMATLERYREQTPEGVQEMLRIPGFGPKKVLTVWKDLGVETIGELLYAVNENRLIELKGFGSKTQEDLRKKLEYYLRSRHRFHYATLEAEAKAVRAALQERLPEARVEFTGDLRRRCVVLDRIELLVGREQPLPEHWAHSILQVEGEEANGLAYFGQTTGELPFRIYVCSPDDWGRHWFRRTGSEAFLSAFAEAFPDALAQAAAAEKAIFDRAGLPFIEPELREQTWALERAREDQLPELIAPADIRGVVHAHSTFSDGLHSVREMAEYCRDQGYAYLTMTDHSQSAFYANGLKPERLYEQWEEIDRLNQELAPFRIFKGIESDILADGSLDYEEDILAQFDIVIASVHSSLRMDEEKATRRLIRAVENPYTHILGHPTGRLLLSREGYPVDHRRVIDACAEHGVAIELNANPYRLDLDWSWIPYALEKGVWIAVNPDAHSQAGVHDIYYGVCAARKGGLTAAQCLNHLDLEAFTRFLKGKSPSH